MRSGRSSLICAKVRSNEAEEIKENIQSTIQEKGATINANNLPAIQISRTGIKQLFQNLIGNAMKYQAEGVKPVVTIKSVEKEDSWQFAVTDNGIGIPEKYLTTVFDMFKRVHTNQNYKGTGLGLSICKKFVTKNGGAIWAESKEGIGSTFYFTIPKNK